MLLKCAICFLPWWVSSCGLPDDSGCDGNCSDDHDGISMLQTQRSLLAKLIEESKSENLKQQEAQFDTIEHSCPVANTNKGEHGAVVGMIPEGDGPFPLAIYLQGTYMSYNNPMSVEMLKQMAQRGFVAVNMHYSNMEYPGGNCQVFESKAGNVASCVDQMCEREKVNCSLGLAVWGYSQGGQVASLVGNYTAHPVTAQLGMSSSIMFHSYSSAGVFMRDAQKCLELKIPRNKRRILAGNKDGHLGGNGARGLGEAADVIAMCQLSLGLQPSDCTDEMRCIQSDGSGYYVASKNETGTFMSHQWFIDMDWSEYSIRGLHSAFTNPPNADAPWGAKANFDWLASTARV